MSIVVFVDRQEEFFILAYHGHPYWVIDLRNDDIICFCFDERMTPSFILNKEYVINKIHPSEKVLSTKKDKSDLDRWLEE